MDPQEQFACHPPQTPLLDKAMAGLGKGLDYLINDVIIGKIGGCLDACCCEIRSMGKASLVSLAPNSIGGGTGESLTPMAPDCHEKSQNGQSQQIARGLEITPQIEKTVSKIDMGKSMDCCHCSEAMCGQLTPTPISYAKVQTQSQGWGIA